MKFDNLDGSNRDYGPFEDATVETSSGTSCKCDSHNADELLHDLAITI